MTTIVNVVQDIATPHNNVLLAALHKAPGTKLNLWYCQDNPEKYGWKINLTHSVQQANIYHAKGVDWDFIRYALKHADEKWFLVGWMNPTTRLLVFLFWLTRRPFNMWFDLPQDTAPRNPLKKLVRAGMYALLKTSRAHIFCVGQLVVDYFKKRGFPTTRLTNLPIIVEIDKTAEDFSAKRKDIFKKYKVKEDGALFSAGSRLIHDKGFDVVIEAVKLLPKAQKQAITCVIVGKGEERENLEQLINDYDLKGQVILEDWLEFTDFQALIAHSTAFLHPARFDAYGATIFAMPLSTPVIGSTGAGAAVDRIVEGKNGFLFNADNPKELSRILAYAMGNPEKMQTMGQHARKTAVKWEPRAAAQILVNNLR